MKLSQLIDQTNMPEKLVKAIIKQSGGWDEFQEMASDIANHGIDGGFSGWIYYRETCGFYRANKKLILEFAESYANDMGENMLSMIQNFGVFRRDPISQNDLAKALYTGRGDDRTTVQNVMAWFVAEELARTCVDLAGSVKIT